MKNYDVIIIGAGVSGLVLANLLKDSRLKVLILEKRNDIKILENHKYGTFTKDLEKSDLKDSIINKYKVFNFSYASKVNKVFTYDKDEFCVVDMNVFTQNLNLNSEYITSSNIKDIKIVKDGVIIQDEKSEYGAKIIVDCSGESKIVSKFLNYPEKIHTDFYSMSLELSNCNISETDKIAFIADIKYTNSAFWFYPYSVDKCQLGITEWLTKYNDIEYEKKKMFSYIKNEPPFNTWLKDCKLDEVVFKIGPAATLNKKICDDNILICGNAAGAGTPLVGEGFRISIDMAKLAHETILHAFDVGDYSLKTLDSYRKNFYNMYGRYYFLSYMIRSIIMKYFSEHEYSLFIDNMGKLNKDEFMECLYSRITIKHIFKITNARLLFSVISNMIQYHLFGKRFNIQKY